MTSDREKERQRSEEKKVTKDENGYDSKIRNDL